MTSPNHARPPIRSHAEYRWTRAKVLAFLDALARGETVAGAARGVGMGRQSAYRLRARLGSGFAQVWDEGQRLGREARGTGLGSGVRRPVQGDTSRGAGRVQGDTSSAQGDTCPAQGDTSGAAR